MQRRWQAFVFLIALIVIMGGALFVRQKLQDGQTAPPATSTPFTETVAENSSQTAMVELDFDGQQPLQQIKVPIDSQATAYSALQIAAEQADISVVTQQYDFGVFVQSIDGLASSTEKAWIYYLNGQSGNVAADQQTVKPGDTVLWKYETPS